MPKRDSSGRFAPKAADVRPIDQLRSGPTADPATVEQLQAEIERLKAGEVPPEYRPQPMHRVTDPPMDPYGAPYDDEPRGCLVPVLVALVFLMGIALAAVLTWLAFRGTSAPPAPAPSPVPVVDLSTYTAPIASKLAYDPAKAARVARIYSGFRDALAGPSGKRVANSGILETVQANYLDDIDIGTGNTPIGAEIDQAIGSYLGMAKSTDAKSGESGWEPKAFTDADRAKLVQIIGAIAKAAEESR